MFHRTIKKNCICFKTELVNSYSGLIDSMYVRLLDIGTIAWAQYIHMNSSFIKWTQDVGILDACIYSQKNYLNRGKIANMMHKC